MKKILLSGVSLLLLASAAQAADLPYKAPAAVAPVPSWAGAYFGVSVGVSGHNASLDLLDIWSIQGYEDEYNGPQRNSSFGFAAGGYAGYNWQFGNTVFGLEADASWHSNKDSQGFMNVDSYELGVLESKMDVFSSYRARLGYALDSWLVYVTGGAALAHTSNTYDVSSKDMYFNRKKWDWGWVVGGGIEHMIAGRLLIRAEVLYANFDGGSTTGSGEDSYNDASFGVGTQEVIIGRIGAAVKF
jgi:outer membrane immunogenic protein